MDLGLRDKYALVTGGSHGIGRAIALALAEEGCNVAICARGQENLKKTKIELEAKQVRSLAIRADITSPGDIKKIFDKIIGSWGSLHILINNAGGGGRWGKEDVIETDEGVWQEVYDKNVTSSVRLIRLFVPYMQKEQWGRVINITSLYGREAGGRPWFNIAKTAQTALIKNLSLNKGLARKGVTFNSIAPGAVMIPDTGWEKEQKKDPKAFKKMIDEKFPLGRMGTPEEVAALVVFICSQKASLINGASIPCDGSEGRSF